LLSDAAFKNSKSPILLIVNAMFRIVTGVIAAAVILNWQLSNPVKA